MYGAERLIGASLVHLDLWRTPGAGDAFALALAARGHPTLETLALGEASDRGMLALARSSALPALREIKKTYPPMLSPEVRAEVNTRFPPRQDR